MYLAGPSKSSVFMLSGRSLSSKAKQGGQHPQSSSLRPDPAAQTPQVGAAGSARPVLLYTSRTRHEGAGSTAAAVPGSALRALAHKVKYTCGSCSTPVILNCLTLWQHSNLSCFETQGSARCLKHGFVFKRMRAGSSWPQAVWLRTRVQQGGPAAAARFPTAAGKRQNEIAAPECPGAEKGDFRNSPRDKGGHLSPRLFGGESDFHSLLMVNQEHAARRLLVGSGGAGSFTGRVLFQLNEVLCLHPALMGKVCKLLAFVGVTEGFFFFLLPSHFCFFSNPLP